MGQRASMNHLERFRAVMNFQSFDRLPRIEWANWWNLTLERWLSEGLPTLNQHETDRYLGLDPYYQHWFFARLRPLPRKSKGHGQGIVTCMDDYLTLRPFLYPTPEIHAIQMGIWGKAQEMGKAVVWISFDGFFWWPRMLLGIERHLYSFYDQPELLHQICTDLVEFQIATLHWLRDYCKPAFMTFAEDMSYNHGPMLSKELFESFLAPYYRQVIPVLKEMGTFVFIDSDGEVGELMKWAMDAGIDGVLPIERQAGCDAARMRKDLPKVRMIGHFDKLVMRHGENAMRNEFERLLPVMRTGGFIPSVDHQTPPDVSLDTYRIYLRLLNEYTERAATE